MIRELLKIFDERKRQLDLMHMKAKSEKEKDLLSARLMEVDFSRNKISDHMNHLAIEESEKRGLAAGMAEPKKYPVNTNIKRKKR